MTSENNQVSHPYQKVPDCILTPLPQINADASSFCAGFELSEWRCDDLADNLINWIVDYALKSEELETSDHTNPYIRLKEAAARIYTSEKYKSRGELGEVAAHAICRAYFQTVPIAARVNFLSSSNDVVKAFDLVHVRYKNESDIELWLGEAKFFKNRNDAIRDAISSIETHITAAFLKNEKLILGPQISRNIPHSQKIRSLFSQEASLDELIGNAVFPVLVAANSEAIASHSSQSEQYTEEVNLEMTKLWNALSASGLTKKIRLMLLYVPLASKDQLSAAFDLRLKGLQL